MKRILALAVSGLLISASAHATEVKEVVTPGGLTVWLVEEHTLPLVAVNVAFRDSGFSHDPEGKEGRANMVAAILTEGAGDMDSRAFNEALENRAIQLNTSADDDLFYISMQTLSEHKDDAFSYLGQVITKPRFDSEAIERTRRQSLSVLTQREQTPGYQLYRGWQKIAYGKHAYGKPQLGTERSIERLDRSDLEFVVSHYITRENALIAVVGDTTPEEISALLDKNLSKLPAKFEPDVKLEDVQLPAGDKPEIIDFNIPQTLVIFGTNGLKRNDPDYLAAYVMNHILGGGGALTARLGQEIREKRGLAYSIASHIDPMTYAAVWRGEFSTRNEQVGTAIDVLRSTIKNFAATGPTTEEMTAAKQYLIGSFVLNLDSNADVANFLISMQFNHLGKDYLNTRNQMIAAVTKEDVKAIAARLLADDKLLIVMAGKPKLSEPKQ